MNNNNQNIAPDYYKILKWFWQEVPHTPGYRPLYGLLFLAIIDSINTNFWRPGTAIDYERIAHKCKFTKEVYLAGRKWLSENNFIVFVPGINNMHMASFSLGAAVGIPTGTPTGEPTAERSEFLPADLPARLPNNKHKTNKHLNSKQQTSVLNFPFIVFWDLYDKKVGNKEKLEKKWAALTDEERQIAIDHIPKYKEAKPDKQYRKDPETYLNNKSFNDEIITSNGKQLTGTNQSNRSKQEQTVSGLIDEVFTEMQRME